MTSDASSILLEHCKRCHIRTDWNNDRTVRPIHCHGLTTGIDHERVTDNPIKREQSIDTVGLTDHRFDTLIDDDGCIRGTHYCLDWELFVLRHRNRWWRWVL